MGSGAGTDPAQLGLTLRAAVRVPLGVIAARCDSCLASGGGFADDVRKIRQAGQSLHGLVDSLAARRPPAGSADSLRPAAGTPAEHVPSACPAPPAPDAPAGVATILVVDDNPDNRHLLSERLRLGYATATAGSGEAALRLIAGQRFDLVLLDVIMPGINGIDVLKQVRQTHSVTDLPVIMVTARDESDEIVAALEAGANDYVTKPVSLPVLSARARTQLLLKQMVAALEAANAQLADLSFRDGLTQIANRRRFDDYLDSEWRRGSRSATPLSVVLVDIDSFKLFNDTYGHEAGDAALKQVAAALCQSVARGSDLVARHGGEEFAAILPDTDGAGAATVAERMCDRVRSLAIPHPGSLAAPYLTVSIGVSTRVPQRGDSAPASLIHAADTRLYQAKHAGRNRVCSTGGTPQANQ